MGQNHFQAPAYTKKEQIYCLLPDQLQYMSRVCSAIPTFFFFVCPQLIHLFFKPLSCSFKAFQLCCQTLFQFFQNLTFHSAYKEKLQETQHRTVNNKEGDLSQQNMKKSPKYLLFTRILGKVPLMSPALRQPASSISKVLSTNNRRNVPTLPVALYKKKK